MAFGPIYDKSRLVIAKPCACGQVTLHSESGLSRQLIPEGNSPDHQEYSRMDGDAGTICGNIGSPTARATG